MVIRQCGHIFVENDLRQWFTRNVRCPLCRYDIRRYSHTRNEEEEEEEEENIINDNNETNDNIENSTSTINDGSNNFIRTFTRTFESNDLRDLSQQLIETFASLEEV